jgi:hypothetical protein
MIVDLATRLIKVEIGAALVFIALGGFIVVMNWWMVIATHRTGQHHSAVPLVGAVLLGAGLALLPQTRLYAWVAILADYGTLILLISLPMLVREAWETSRYNLTAEYRGGRGIMTAHISLYRGDICIIRYDMKRAAGEMGIMSTSRVGTWRQEGQRLTLQVGDTSAEFEVVSEGKAEFLRQLHGFSWESNGELSLTNVALVRMAGSGRGLRCRPRAVNWW